MHNGYFLGVDVGSVPVSGQAFTVPVVTGWHSLLRPSPSFALAASVSNSLRQRSGNKFVKR